MMFISLASWIILIGANSMIDANRNNHEKGILFGYHLAAWMIRYGVAFLLILLVWYQGDVPYSRETVGVFLIKGGIAWIEFDLLYNWIRWFVSWDHVGTTSWLDKIFHKFPNPLLAQYVAKAIILVSGILLYFI